MKSNSDRKNHITIPASQGDINMYQQKIITDLVLSTVMEFDGHLDIQRLERSLADLANLVPILTCVLKVKGLRVKWEQIPNQKIDIYIREIIGEGKGELTEFVSATWNIHNEPPIKILVLRSENRDTLCIKVDHVVVDAIGLKFLCYLLSDLYTKGNSSIKINCNRGAKQIFKRFSLLTILRNLIVKNLSLKPPSLFMEGDFEKENKFFERISLCPNEFKKLYSKAKSDNVTVNDAMITALYRTVFNVIPLNYNEDFPIFIPVDMRRYLEKDKKYIIGNISTATIFSLSKKESESFSETLHRLKAKMRGIMEYNPGLPFMTLTKICTAFGGYLMKKVYEITLSKSEPRDLVLSNIGVFDEEHLIFDGVDLESIYTVSSNQYAPAITILVSTYRNTLSYVIRSNDTKRFQPYVKDFLLRNINELKQYSES